MRTRILGFIVAAVLLLAPATLIAQVDVGGGGSGTGIASKGAYAGGTVYKKGDLVTYGGATYLKIANSAAGIVPTNATYWTKLGILTGPSKLLDVTFGDVTTGDPTRGDIVTAQGASPKWAKLAKGGAATILTMGADEPAWAAPVTQTSALLSAVHTDTTAAAPTRGDVITAQGASPTWKVLAKGAPGTVLKMGADEPAWGGVTLPTTYVYRKAAYCYGNGTCGMTTEWDWNGLDSGLPTFSAGGAGTLARASADFSDAAVKHFQTDFNLPADWDAGTITLDVYWFANVADAGKSAVWQAATVCGSHGDALNTALGAYATVTSAAHASAYRLRVGTITLNTVGCAAGDVMTVDVKRDPNHGSDNLGATAGLLAVRLGYGRS